MPIAAITLWAGIHQIVGKNKIGINWFWLRCFRLAAIFGQFPFAKFSLVVFPVILPIALVIGFTATFIAMIKTRLSTERGGIAGFNQHFARLIGTLRQFHADQFFNIAQKRLFAF